MMRKILITGVSGFVGGHFAGHLLAKRQDIVIHGLSRSKPAWDFVPADVREAVIFHQLDLLDKEGTAKLLAAIEPDSILHLASFSSVGASWKRPVECFLNNATAFLNLIEGVRLHGIKCKILSVGSSEEYGVVSVESLPLIEDRCVTPANPYAVARVSQEHLANVYAGGFGLDISCTRSFNHIGPGQSPDFVVSSIVKHFAEIKLNKRPPIIKIGEGRIVRDFTAIEDVILAYEQLLEKGGSGEVYNVCSGKGFSIKDIVDMVSSICRIKVDIEQDEALIRPVDNPILIGDYGKLERRTGWRPRVDLEDSLKSMFDYWVRKPATEA